MRNGRSFDKILKIQTEKEFKISKRDPLFRLFLLYGDSRTPKSLKVGYVVLNADEGVQQLSAIGKSTVVNDGASLKLMCDRKTLGGECEWILPRVGEPSISQQGNDLFIVVPHRQPGPWIGVYMIKSKRANLHGTPDENDVEKAFLVSRDTILVYEERNSSNRAGVSIYAGRYGETLWRASSTLH